jgi:predicted enzyme related to lactoylglutathione lyase
MLNDRDEWVMQGSFLPQYGIKSFLRGAAWWLSLRKRPASHLLFMIKGLRTVIYPAPDLPKAKAWYESVFQRKPYFDEPFYVGFEIGGFELGLLPDAEPGDAGAKALWGVEDIQREIQRLQAIGVVIAGGVQDVGEGIKIVDLVDPFGNLVGLIENPNFQPDKMQ